MSTTYPVGTVAMLSGTADQPDGEEIALKVYAGSEDGWRTANGMWSDPPKVRPLVVIDPEDAEQVADFIAKIRRLRSAQEDALAPSAFDDAVLSALRRTAAPSLPEPGPLAVVRVTTRREATSWTTQLMVHQETTRDDGMHWGAHSHTWAMVCAMDVAGAPEVVNPSPITEGAGATR